MDELEVRRAVRDAYGARAGDSCCGPAEASCCGPAATTGEDVPRLGVGRTLTVLAPKPGETVLDLGSGPGADVLEAAALVGPAGRAIGVDATPEMIHAARERARQAGRSNAEFRLGEIEHLPVESGSVDGVVSDCVINLSPAKDAVFREAFRVLRPGGRIVVSDVVAVGELPREVREDPKAWAACVAGAVSEEEYRGAMAHAGFVDIRATGPGGTFAAGLRTAVLEARKP